MLTPARGAVPRVARVRAGAWRRSASIAQAPSRKAFPAGRFGSSCHSRRAGRSMISLAYSAPARAAFRTAGGGGKPCRGRWHLGADVVAKSSPDAPRSCRPPTVRPISPSLLTARWPFDAVTDFIPVTQLVASTLVLVAGPGLPVGSTQELIALAK